MTGFLIFILLPLLEHAFLHTTTAVVSCDKLCCVSIIVKSRFALNSVAILPATWMQQATVGWNVSFCSQKKHIFCPQFPMVDRQHIQSSSLNLSLHNGPILHSGRSNCWHVALKRDFRRSSYNFQHLLKSPGHVTKVHTYFKLSNIFLWCLFLQKRSQVYLLFWAICLFSSALNIQIAMIEPSPF